MECVPELTSELEHDYPILKETSKFLNVYGPIGCGKTTVVKTYMKNRSHHYIGDYNQTLEQFVDFIKKINNVDVMSYFTNQKENTTIIIDNYDYYSFKYKDVEKYLRSFNIIVISNVKYFENALYIQQPSDEYLLGLLYSINNVYDTDYVDVNINRSFLKFFSSIKFGSSIEFDNFYSELQCLSDIYYTKNINLLLYDVNNMHNTYLYHVNSIDKAANLSDAVSASILLSCTEYYQCISNMIVYSLDNKIKSIANIKLNYHTRSKIYKECKKRNVDPCELSIVKKIEK